MNFGIIGVGSFGIKRAKAIQNSKGSLSKIYDVNKENLKKASEELKIDPCPPKNPQFRKGDYRNDKRIERLVKYERGIDGSCDPVWTEVPFRESIIGTPEVLISTTVIGLVAGGSAALVPLIQGAAKAAIKNIGKRLTKSKASTNESEGSPDREVQ